MSATKQMTKKSAKRRAEDDQKLPIHEARDKILASYDKHSCLLIIGETGSGKTTQVPQFLLQRDPKLRIAVTQPRRVAAMSLAKRVSEEMHMELGKQVGYSVRFEECSSRETQIKFVTDGMLLRELLSDATLGKYGCVILDEAHERTLRTDILFGMLKRIQKQRKNPLKLVIMSATLDPKPFLSFFPNSDVVTVPGRQYPVRLFYTPAPQPDYLEATLITIAQLHREKPPGDILTFLTGQEEIETAQRLLIENAKHFERKMLVCPIFASMPGHQQMAAFRPAPPGIRKVILATNIAETSITIPGVRYVIDPGFVKQRQYFGKTGMEALAVVPCSQSSARQRMGRAGREAPGECYRLYPEDEFQKLPVESPPEILRTSLSSVILTMKASGIEDVISFDYLDKPPAEGLQRGLEELLALGALDKYTGRLTQIGRLMAECPLVPILSRILLEAGKNACIEEVIIILAMLSAENIFVGTTDERDQATQMRRTFFDKTGDHMTLLNLYRTYEEVKENERTHWCKGRFLDPRALKTASDVRKQLQEFCARNGLAANSNSCIDSVVILRTLCSGYFMQAAFKQPDQSYRNLVHRQLVHIHPSSTLFNTRPECVIYHELTVTTRNYLRVVSVINPEWLLDWNQRANTVGMGASTEAQR